MQILIGDSSFARMLGRVRPLVQLAGAFTCGVFILSFGASAQQAQFDVASIRASTYTRGLPVGITVSGSNFTADNVSLKDLIMYAYDVKQFQVVGGPSWAVGTGPSIGIQTGAALYRIAATFGDRRDVSVEQIRQMVQALLAERFHLRVQRAPKEMPVYTLVVAKNGPKLQAAASPRRKNLSYDAGGEIVIRTAEAIADFTVDLAAYSGRPVVDRTGLQGVFDCTLHFVLDANLASQLGLPPQQGNAPADPNVPPLFTAIEEQLGLKLESQRAPIDAVVIDRAERPSEN